ncbi:uncharacterized protein TEOVI_000082200 [Trypanosoma equiperdum]|uniref:Uncharacterized protein n=1 Tax=Trypanosoma equiperdum TaxID=5694 RepID=A0A1G4IAG9_TRYEQ|nr:hypothetical protein, conserved [Trypanosoma equiperdum]
MKYRQCSLTTKSGGKDLGMRTDAMVQRLRESEVLHYTTCLNALESVRTLQLCNEALTTWHCLQRVNASTVSPPSLHNVGL